MSRRKHHTLELFGNTDMSTLRLSDLEERLSKSTGSERELSTFLSTLLDSIRLEPIVVRFTKESFTVPKLVIFDLDSTLVQSEFMARIGAAEEHNPDRKNKLLTLTQEALKGAGDWARNFTERVRLLKGMDIELLHSYYKTIPLSEGAQQLMAMLRYHEIPTAIVSGAWLEYVQYIADCLQIDERFGSEWELSEGYLTGHIVGQPIGPQTKVSIMKELAAKYGITTDEVVVIADGHNDLPMMIEAGCTFMISTSQEPSPSFLPIQSSLENDLSTT